MTCNFQRAERRNHGMDEEESEGSQISMAHAALLNLRGAEAQAQMGGLKDPFAQRGGNQFGGRSKLGESRSKGYRSHEGCYIYLFLAST